MGLTQFSLIKENIYSTAHLKEWRKNTFTLKYLLLQQTSLNGIGQSH